MNQNPIASGSQMPQPPAPKQGIGPIAGAIIVILLLIVGGLYFWGAKINRDMPENTVPFIPSNDTAPEEELPGELQSDTGAGLPPQSSSDDVSSIEADFNAMDMTELEAQNEAELNSI